MSKGFLIAADGTKYEVFDTKRENNLAIHLMKKLPATLEGDFRAVVDEERRHRIEANHSATHLLHEALREVLGSHVEQKGSFVSDEVLRFDFAHFAKVEPEQLRAVERIVAARIRACIPLQEYREVPIDEAREMGAMALFGEKYGITSASSALAHRPNLWGDARRLYGCDSVRCASRVSPP